MSKILLTGATGLIGRELASRLAYESGISEIRLLVRNKNHESLNRILEAGKDNRLPIKIFQGDLSQLDLGLIRPSEVFTGLDEVYHLAADTKLGGDNSLVNTNGISNLFNWMDSSTLTFNHISSAYACGNYKGIVPEAQLKYPKSFRTAYEKSKFEGERLVFEANENMGLSFNIFRPSIVLFDNTSSPGIENQTIYRYLDSIDKLRKLSNKSESFRLKGDITSKLNVVFSDEVCSYILRSREMGFKNKVFNLTGVDFPLKNIVNIVESENKEYGRYSFSSDLEYGNLNRGEKLAYYGSKPFWNYLVSENNPKWSTEKRNSLKKYLPSKNANDIENNLRKYLRQKNE